AGAMCPDCAPGDDEDIEDDDEAEKAIKSILADPAGYAEAERADISTAAGALSTVTMLIQSEDEGGDVAQLCGAAKSLIEFITGEIDGLLGAANATATKGIEIVHPDDGDEIAVVSGYAVKSLGSDGMVGGYLVKFGGD